MAKTIEILEDRNCYNNLVDECSRWMSVLLFVIDFSSADGLQCITFFVEGISHLPKSLVTHCTEEVLTSSLRRVHNLFQIFSSTTNS